MIPILCFGEILWDELPTGSFPGGAPLNVAYHARALGLDPLLISAVGNDEDGARLRARMQAWGLELTGVTRNRRPTGSVRATLNAAGEPAYVIAENVAWDEILPTGTACKAATTARALVFGSLALRTPVNRRTLDGLRAFLPRTAERVFDVNLRAPFYQLDHVRDLARLSTLLKVNATEAEVLSGSATPARPEDCARKLALHFPAADILVTAGAEGAGLFRQGQWYWEASRPVEVVDPIGAGDAFLAAFLAARLRGEDPAICLAAGCRRGEWVVAQPGATPETPYPSKLVAR